MRITIVPLDGTVIIDNRAITGIDMSSIPDEIHAVQWYENYGEVEYKSYLSGEGPQSIVKPANKIINDLSEYQTVIDLWESASQIEGISEGA